MNLKTLRKSANLTQTELAKICDISLRAYQNYESQLREMNYKTLKKLADYFNCSVDYLIGHQGKGLLYTNDLSEDQVELINEIKNMDEREVNLLKGALIRIKMEQESPWLKNRT